MPAEIRIGCAATSYTFPPGVLGAQEKTVDIRSYVVAQDGSAVLIDALLPGHEQAIEDALRELGCGYEMVRSIIITHAHPDHVGSLEAVAAKASGAEVCAGAAEASQFSIPGRPVRPLHDGDEVHGLRIVATPGHTPGHISVLEPETATLFTGDAAVNMDGLACSIEAFDTDHQLALAQLGKLADLGFDRCMFAHGQEIGSAASLAFRQLADGLAARR